MNEDIEYLLHNYLRSKGNLRALKQLLTVLECDFIYHIIKPNER